MLVTIDTQQLHPDGDVMAFCSVVNKNRERVQGANLCVSDCRSAGSGSHWL